MASTPEITPEIMPASAADPPSTPPPHGEKMPSSSAPTVGADIRESSEQSHTMATAPVLETSAAPDSDSGSVDSAFRSSRQFKLAFAALCVLTVAVALDATTLSVALPKMSTELGGTAIEAFWAGTSFLLASCVLQPSIAAASGIFGRKETIYACCVVFGVGSVIAALANDFTVLLVGRTIQGIGGGGIIALTEVVITDMVPLSNRGNYFSGLSGAWAVGTVAGPLVGAAIVQKSTWRWIFWLNLPILGVGMVLVYRFLKLQRPAGGIVHKLGRMDWTGSFLFTAGSTILLFGISVGGIMYEWASYQTLLPLLLGVVVILVFTFWELRHAEEPMIQRGVFNNWTMISSYLQGIMHGMVLWSLLYFLTLYYQGVKLKDPIGAGVAVLPETLTVAPAGAIVGYLSSKTGRYRWGVWIGWVLATLGSGLLYLLDADTTTGQWIGLNIPIGIGTGMLFPAVAMTIQAACVPALNAEAAAFFSFIRVFGQSIGVATSGVIFQNSFRDKLLDTGVAELAAAADAYSHDATAMVAVIQGMVASPTRDALIHAYNEGLRIIWISLIAFSAVGMLLSLSIKAYTLNQKHVTKHRMIKSGAQHKTGVPDLESKGADGEKVLS